MQLSLTMLHATQIPGLRSRTFFVLVKMKSACVTSKGFETLGKRLEFSISVFWGKSWNATEQQICTRRRTCTVTAFPKVAHLAFCWSGFFFWLTSLVLTFPTFHYEVLNCSFPLYSIEGGNTSSDGAQVATKNDSGRHRPCKDTRIKTLKSTCCDRERNRVSVKIWRYGSICKDTTHRFIIVSNRVKSWTTLFWLTQPFLRLGVYKGNRMFVRGCLFVRVQQNCKYIKQGTTAGVNRLTRQLFCGDFCEIPHHLEAKFLAITTRNMTVVPARAWWWWWWWWSLGVSLT